MANDADAAALVLVRYDERGRGSACDVAGDSVGGPRVVQVNMGRIPTGTISQLAWFDRI
jgi:hypothetical protein